MKTIWDLLQDYTGTEEERASILKEEYAYTAYKKVQSISSSEYPLTDIYIYESATDATRASDKLYLKIQLPGYSLTDATTEQSTSKTVSITANESSNSVTIATKNDDELDTSNGPYGTQTRLVQAGIKHYNSSELNDNSNAYTTVYTIPDSFTVKDMKVNMQNGLITIACNSAVSSTNNVEYKYSTSEDSTQILSEDQASQG